MFGAASTTSSGTGFTFGAPGTSTASSGGFSGFNFGAATTSGATGATSAGGFGGFSFSGSTPSSSAAPGFNFGAAKPAGGATTGFGFNLAQPPPTSQAPSISAGFPFGQPVTTSDSSSTLTSSATSGFGFKTDATSSAPSTAFSAAGETSGSLLGGLLSAPTTAATSVAPTTITSLAPSSGFSFGAPASAPATTAATSLPSSTGFGFGFGTSQPSSTAPSLGSSSLSVFGNTPSSVSAVSTALPTSTGIVTAGLTPVQKQMTFRQLEDTINKWTAELEEQEKYFLEQATQVNAWDRVVMDNGEKIVQLNKDVEKVKLDQQKLDHELDFVQSQQKELEDILVPLEKALDSMPPINYQQHADIEREHTYTLAESLDAQLKRMGQDLKEIIERLNATNSKPEVDDPVHQITKILNAHFMSLMWVDRNTANLQKRVEEISKQMEIERREQEKNFRLAYS
ncbi:Nuclear pore glycoprotein p62 [Bulinus truncatus]|nr:Nuclear pore glycoprotein p62 [Bulinus truncatus]